MTCKCRHVPDYYELHASTCHGHIHTSEITEETYVAVIVAAYKGDNNYIPFLTLESVDCIHRYEVAERFEEGGAFDKITQILHLCPVWRDEANINAFVKKTFFPDFLYIVLKDQ